MIVLDGLITVVALPAIQRDLGLNAAALSGVVTVYAIAVGGFLLLAGRASDIFGRRLLFVAGAFVFSASSLVCGLAESEGTLLTGRFFQGLGGAMMTSSRFADSRGVFAGIVEIAVVGYVLVKGMALLRRRLLLWHQEALTPSTV